MARGKVAKTVDPRILRAMERREAAHVSFERAYLKMRRALARMERARQDIRLAAKLIARVSAELDQVDDGED